MFLCFQFIISVAARKASDNSQRLTAQQLRTRTVDDTPLQTFQTNNNITLDAHNALSQILLLTKSMSATSLRSLYFSCLQTCSRLPTRNYANECTIKRESTKHRRIIENANTVVDVSEPTCRGETVVYLVIVFVVDDDD
ncbi:hypothetical protein T07_1629 [Trichinella nelsoni]|uniref:Uncharacterized protein n=1 Tax=Trichinella nelsoni TaxID=6336 RepID=A0A0V0SGG7_9BILA|nr:hypothetical protein T07_1629 [Trichinella nelsoni]